MMDGYDGIAVWTGNVSPSHVSFFTTAGLCKPTNGTDWVWFTLAQVVGEGRSLPASPHRTVGYLDTNDMIREHRLELLPGTNSHISLHQT
jgi:hypothetical protein